MAFYFSNPLKADGGFVWTGYERLREPDQKAIIVFDGGIEDLFLKVKFEGKISEFGWIVPLPTKPEVKKVTFSCFHLLDMRYKLGKKLYHTPMDIIKDALLSRYQTLGSGQGVKILSDSEIGDFQVKILKAGGGKSLQNWLKENNFKVPAGGDKVLDSYIKKNWYFVAIKVKTGSQTKEKQELLKRGELAPLHFTFNTDKPVYPLHISSLNEGITHLKLFLYARELYANKFLLPQERDFTPYKQYQQKLQKMDDNYGDLEGLLAIEEEPFGFYLNKHLPPSLRHEIRRPLRGRWYCSRFDKKIPCKEMQNDIIFSNDKNLVKELVSNNRDIEKKLGYTFDKFDNPKGVLEHSWQWLARDELDDKYETCKTLDELEEKSMPPFKVPPKLKASVSKEEMQKKVKEIISISDRGWYEFGTLDKKEEDKLYSAAKKWLADGKLTKGFVDFLKGFNLYNDYRWYCPDKKEEAKLRSFLPEYETRLSYPEDYVSLPQYLVKPEGKLFDDGSAFEGEYFIQAQPGFKSMGRGSYFSKAIPFHRRFLIHVYYETIKKGKDLNDRPWEENKQYEALNLLIEYRDPRSFKILSKWLKNKNPAVRKTALSIMLNSLFNCVEGTSGEWGLRAYIFDSAFDKRKINSNLIRPLLEDPDFDCRRYAAWILALLGDEKAKPFFLKSATDAGEVIPAPKSTGKKQKADERQFELEAMAKPALIAMANNKNQDYKNLIIDLLKKDSNSLISQDHLLIAASAYFDDPVVKKLIFNKKNIVSFIPITEIIREPLLKWLDSEIKKSNDPELNLVKIIYSTNDGKYELKAIKNQIKEILNQQATTLDVLARVEEFQENFGYFEGYYFNMYWEDTGDSILYKNFDQLIPFFEERKNELLSFSPGTSWAWRVLPTGRLGKFSPEKRIKMIKEVLRFQDQAVKNGKITREELRKKWNRRNLLRWAVLSDIPDQDQKKELKLNKNNSHHELVLLLDEWNEDKDYFKVRMFEDLDNFNLLEEKSAQFSLDSPNWTDEYIAILFNEFKEFFKEKKESITKWEHDLTSPREYFGVIRKDSELLKEIIKRIDRRIKEWKPEGEDLTKLQDFKKQIAAQLKKNQ